MNKFISLSLLINFLISTAPISAVKNYNCVHDEYIHHFNNKSVTGRQAYSVPEGRKYV